MMFILRRHHLNKYGYDNCGCYYGVGPPLYWYCSDDYKHEDMIRASSRDDAKAQIKRLHPTLNPRFYR